MSSSKDKGFGKEQGVPEDHKRNVKPALGVSSVDLTNIPSSDEEDEVKVVGVKPPSRGTKCATKTPYKVTSDADLEAPRHVSHSKSSPGHSKSTPGRSPYGLLGRGRDIAVSQGRRLANNFVHKSRAYVVSPTFKTLVDKSNVSLKQPPKSSSSSTAKSLDTLQNGKVWQTGHKESFLKAPPPTAGRGCWAYDYHAAERAANPRLFVPHGVGDNLQGIGGAQMNLGDVDPIVPIVRKDELMTGHPRMSKKQRDKVNEHNRAVEEAYNQRYKKAIEYIALVKALVKAQDDVERELEFFRGSRTDNKVLQLQAPKECSQLKEQFMKDLDFYDDTEALPPGVELFAGLPVAMMHVQTSTSDGEGEGTMSQGNQVEAANPTTMSPTATRNESPVPSAHHSEENKEKVAPAHRPEDKKKVASTSYPSEASNKKVASTTKPQLKVPAVANTSFIPSGASAAQEAQAAASLSAADENNMNKAATSSSATDKNKASTVTLSPVEKKKAAMANTLVTPSGGEAPPAAAFLSPGNKHQATESVVANSEKKAKSGESVKNQHFCVVVANSKANDDNINGKTSSKALTRSDGDGLVYDKIRNKWYLVEHRTLYKYWHECDEHGVKKNPYSKEILQIKYRENENVRLEVCSNFGLKCAPANLLPFRPASHCKKNIEIANANPNGSSSTFNLPEDEEDLANEQKEEEVDDMVGLTQEMIDVAVKTEEEYKMRRDVKKTLKSSQKELFGRGPGSIATPAQDAAKGNVKNNDRAAKMKPKLNAGAQGGNIGDDISKKESKEAAGTGADNQQEGLLDPNDEHTEQDNVDVNTRQVSKRGNKGGPGRDLEQEPRNEPMEGVQERIEKSNQAVQEESNQAVQNESHLVGSPTQPMEGVKESSEESNQRVQEENNMVGSPTQPMFGPFHAGVLETPLPRTMSDTPPPRPNPERGLNFKVEGTPPKFPSDERLGLLAHDDNDDDDDNDDGNDSDFDPDAIREVRDYENFADALVDFVLDPMDRLNRRMDELTEGFETLHKEITSRQEGERADEVGAARSAHFFEESSDSDSDLFGKRKCNSGKKPRAGISSDSSESKDERNTKCQAVDVADKHPGSRKKKNIFIDSECEESRSVVYAEEDEILSDEDNEDVDSQLGRSKDGKLSAPRKRKAFLDDSTSESSQENEFGNDGDEDNDHNEHEDKGRGTKGAKFRMNMKTIYDEEEEEEEDADDDESKDEDNTDDDVMDRAL